MPHCPSAMAGEASSGNTRAQGCASDISKSETCSNTHAPPHSSESQRKQVPQTTPCSDAHQMWNVRVKPSSTEAFFSVQKSIKIKALRKKKNSKLSPLTSCTHHNMLHKCPSRVHASQLLRPTAARLKNTGYQETREV